jgi:hypothetical protein
MSLSVDGVGHPLSPRHTEKITGTGITRQQVRTLEALNLELTNYSNGKENRIGALKTKRVSFADDYSATRVAKQPSSKLRLSNKRLTAENERLTAENERLTAENERLTAENEYLGVQQPTPSQLFSDTDDGF